MIFLHTRINRSTHFEIPAPGSTLRRKSDNWDHNKTFFRYQRAENNVGKSQWWANEWDGEDCANSAAAKRFMGNERGL